MVWLRQSRPEDLSEPRFSVAVVLHNIRSAHNVGSVFRTADAAGVNKIFLTGYTPGLTDPRGKVRKEFVKVSLGAEKTVPYSSSKQLAPVLRKLKKDGYSVVALEQHKKAISLFKYKPKNKSGQRIAILLGNEVRGLSKQALALADTVVEIPMHGKKESLNVSVAAGIALFTIINS